MLDFGRSDDPRVQAQLDRLSALSVPQGRLGLETSFALMERLGNPHQNLPPVFHVAGTNGKGSVCTFLRAMLEAEGKRVHVTTSPHLVRYNERIRIAGKLIADAELAALLEEVLDASECDGKNLGPSFFEVTVAAAFLAFSRMPADACVVEVGMGGRFDATNVIARPAVCGVAALGIDHERFLLAPEDGVPSQPMARIAFEKAGIAKNGVPLVTMGDCYPEEAQSAIDEVAERVGASSLRYGHEWHCALLRGRLDYREATGNVSLDLPAPSITGEHQALNAGLAIAMLRAQDAVAASDDSIARGLTDARWPARLQRLAPGPLTSLVPGRTVILDGGHNDSAGQALARSLDGPVHLVLGMLANKNPNAVIDPLAQRMRSLTAIPVPGHESHPPAAFGPMARASSTLEEAFRAIPNDDCPILIAGSLYLAGEALRLNEEIPD